MPLGVKVTRPNGGEYWQAGATEEIRWDFTGITAALTGFSLDYSIDGGGSWTAITTTAVSARSYSWVVLNTPSTQSRVRVTARTIWNISLGSDVSDGNFTIYAATPTPTPTPTATATPTLTPTPTATATWTPAATATPTPTPTPTPDSGGPPPPPPVGGTQVTYSAGWNIVAGPAGATFPGAGAMLYTVQEGLAYTVQPNAQGVKEGWGYWANFASDTTIAFASAGSSFYSTTLSPGQTKMVGNPSATKDATVNAEKIYLYDPKMGYSVYFGTATLKVGQGAWAYSASGGTVTVTAQ